MKTRFYLLMLPVAGLLVLSGCKTTPQYTKRPDFLSSYDHLQKVDATTWRYVSPVLLANCEKFTIAPVKVMFSEFQGKQVTPEQRQRSSDFVRNAVLTQVSGRYPVVSEAGPQVGEIRLAVTEAYRTGGKLGLCVQGEIVDNSNTQVAAVLKTELSQYYAPGWEDKDSAKQMVNAWAERLIKAIDQAHGRPVQ